MAIAAKEEGEPMNTLGLNEIRSTAKAPDLPERQLPDDFPPLESLKGNVLKKQKERDYSRGRQRGARSGKGRGGPTSRDGSATSTHSESDGSKFDGGQRQIRGRGRGRGRGRRGSRPPRFRGTGRGATNAGNKEKPKDENNAGATSSGNENQTPANAKVGNLQFQPNIMPPNINIHPAQLQQMSQTFGGPGNYAHSLQPTINFTPNGSFVTCGPNHV